MALTKVTGQVIKNTTDVTVGVLTVTNTLSVGGTVSIGGTLTYEDVTNVDAVGLITARNGIVVGSGITLSKDGDIFATGISTFTGLVDANGGAHIDNLRLGIDADNDITTSAGNLTLDSAGGNVVINDNLDVDGTTTVDGDFSIADKIIHTGDINTTIRFPAADTVSVETAGSEAARISSDGDLGVGMSDPWARLVVHETSSNTSLTGHNYLASQSGMSIENGSTTDGCFSVYTARVKNAAGTQQSGSLAFKSVNSAYSPEIHLTQRTGSGTQATRIAIDSSGRLLIGHSQTTSKDRQIQLVGTDADSSAYMALRHSADANGSRIDLCKSRNATPGSNTIVQEDDVLGSIDFLGDDGTDVQSVGASIIAQVDDTPGTNDMPSRLVFRTTPDGSNATVERVRIKSSGETMIKGDDNPCLSVDRGSANTTNINILYNGSNRAQLSAASGGFEMSAVGDIPMQLFTNGTEKVRVLGGSMPVLKTGAVAVTDIYNTSGTGNEGAWLVAGGSSQFAASNTNVMRVNRKSSNGTIIKFYYNGSETGSISTNGNNLPSDRNYKKNISDLNLGLSLVNKLKPSQFNFKVDEPNTPVMYGLIAQELEESLISEGVTKNSTQLIQHHPTDNDKESDYDVDYLKLVPILINSIKELSTEIETLKAEVAALKS